MTSAPLIAIDEARRRIARTVRPLADETVPVTRAGERVLADDLRAAGDVPPFPCSAMDGYALTAGPAGRGLRVTDEARAGAPATAALAADEAIRISTGARIPAGSEAVIPQEETRLEGATVVVTSAVERGDHIRGAGEDMRAGSLVLSAGTRLGPIELGAAIAAGASRLAVSARPRVAALATGDELRDPGTPLSPGAIHDTNGPMLAGLAERCGARAATPERLPDDRPATVAGIAAALAAADVVLISGGVSVGPHDHVKPALAELGVKEIFWSVALQPGKPTWFGAAPNGSLVFGLPGNPVSTAVTFSLFVAPALAALQGAPIPRPPHHEARLGQALARNPRRDQAVRVSLRTTASGILVAHPTGRQGSHLLTSLLAADALAMIPAGNGSLPANARVGLEAFVR